MVNTKNSLKFKKFIIYILLIIFLPLVSALSTITDQRIDTIFLNGTNLTLSTSLNVSGNLFANSTSVRIGVINSAYTLEVLGTLNISGRTYLAENVFINATTLGVGTSSPTQFLDVRGITNFSSEIYLQNSSPVSLWVYNQSAPVITLLNGTYAGLWYNHTSAANLSIFNTYDSRWSSVFNQTYQDFAYNQSHWNLSGSNLFAKSTGWNVGVGTTSPAQTLNVVGTLNATGNTFLTNNVFVNASSVGIGTVTPSQLLNVVGNANITGNTFLTNNVFVNASSVGIGTTAPNRRLTIVGDINLNPSTDTDTSIQFADNRGSIDYIASPTAVYLTGGSGRPAGIRVGGTTIALHANTSGSIGIGTTSPTHTLNVLGSTNITLNTTIGNTLFVNANNNQVGIGTTSPVNTLNIVGGTNITTNLSAGNTLFVNGSSVGIGILNMSRTLHVIGNVNITQNTTIGETLFINFNNGNVGIGTTNPTDNVLQLERNNADVGIEFTDTGDVNWVTGIDFSDSRKFKISAAADLSNSNIMTLQSNGNVGIGTTSPLVKFQTKVGTDMDMAIQQATDDGGGAITGVKLNAFNDAGNTAALMQFGASSFTWKITETAKMTLDTNGNVGIGTTSPVYPLQVQAAGNATNITLWVSGNMSATGYITRTHIWDENKGSALKYFQNVTKFKKSDGSINHSAYQVGYASYSNQRQNGTVAVTTTMQQEVNGTLVNVTSTIISPTFETFTEEGVLLDAVVAKHEQAIFELTEKVKRMEATLCSLGKVEYC